LATSKYSVDKRHGHFRCLCLFLITGARESTFDQGEREASGGIWAGVQTYMGNLEVG
jgi:hypothetical protein